MLKSKFIAFLTLTSACFVSGLWANETTPNKIEISFESFNDANDVQSNTGVFSWTHQWNELWSSTYNQEVDGVTGASRNLASYARQTANAITGASLPKPTPFDGITGATTYEIRLGQGLQLTRSNHGQIISGGVSSSFENDYRSFSPNISWSQDFFDRNFTLGVAQSLFFDRFTPVQPFFQSNPGGDKNITNTVISIAQSLTPLTMFGANIVYTNSSGYLGHPYNPVTVFGSNLVPENLPNIKSSTAIAANLIQGFLIAELLGNVRLDYRYYTDSWGLHSNTYDLSVTQKFAETFSVRLRSRFYQQTGVSFLAENNRARDSIPTNIKHSYLEIDEFRTADIRFYPFFSVLNGIKFSGAFPESWVGILPQEWDIKYDYMWRNTKGDRTLYQLYSENSFYTQHDVLISLRYLF
jgi:hypothetical protein